MRPVAPAVRDVAAVVEKEAGQAVAARQLARVARLAVRVRAPQHEGHLVDAAGDGAVPRMHTLVWPERPLQRPEWPLHPLWPLRPTTQKTRFASPCTYPAVRPFVRCGVRRPSCVRLACPAGEWSCAVVLNLVHMYIYSCIIILKY